MATAKLVASFASKLMWTLVTLSLVALSFFASFVLGGMSIGMTPKVLVAPNGISFSLAEPHHIGLIPGIVLPLLMFGGVALACYMFTLIDDIWKAETN